MKSKLPVKFLYLLTFLAIAGTMVLISFSFREENEDLDLAVYPDQDLNKYVLQVIQSYSIGMYPYLLNSDYENYSGVTADVIFRGQTVLKAHPSGNRACHCVGITFEVFYKAIRERNAVLGLPMESLNKMTGKEFKEFIGIWYVAKGDKKYSNCAEAIEKYGLGKRIKRLKDAKSGDFIDISRENNTGHTAVFLNWVSDRGKIVGLSYWSSQKSTNGINYNTEFFNVKNKDGSKYGNVMINQVYIGRVGPVKNYRNFN